MKKTPIQIGKKFGELTVIKEVEMYKKIYNNRPHYYRQVLVSCSCGSTPKVVRFNSLKRGNSTSCGCVTCLCNLFNLPIDKVYGNWRNMHVRCYDETYGYFANYGGKGITVDKEWHSIIPFIYWCDLVGYKENQYLNRIDLTKPYSQYNCIFSLYKQEA